MNSLIGRKEIEIDELRDAGYAFSDDILAVSVDADDIEPGGSVTGGWQHRRDGAEVLEEELSAANITLCESYIASTEYQDWYLTEFGVAPGEAFERKTPLELLATFQAHPSWAEIEAEAKVYGWALWDLAEEYGVLRYKPVEEDID